MGIKDMSITLVSGRTAKQGVGLEEGKLSEAYSESVNHVQLCPEDIKNLGLKESDRVKITTEHGSVVVNWDEDKGLDSGMVFFPYGPWANQVYSTVTSSTGMPVMKGIPAVIAVTGEKVPSLKEIVDMIRGSS